MTLFLLQKKIFFAAYRTSGNQDFSGTITYDIADINEGAGFNKNTGTFRAPEGGTYGFTFSGTSSLNDPSVTYVRVYKDGNQQHGIGDFNAANWGNNLSSSWMMQLSKNEEVYLSVSAGKLFASSSWPVIFTGNLLKLDD